MYCTSYIFRYFTDTLIWVMEPLFIFHTCTETLLYTQMFEIFHVSRFFQCLSYIHYSNSSHSTTLDTRQTHVCATTHSVRGYTGPQCGDKNWSIESAYCYLYVHMVLTTMYTVLLRHLLIFEFNCARDSDFPRFSVRMTRFILTVCIQSYELCKISQCIIYDTRFF